MYESHIESKKLVALLKVEGMMRNYYNLLRRLLF